MTTPPTVTADLGWALGTVLRAYVTAAHAVLADLPGGPRGYQVLAAATDDTGSQLALAQKLGVRRPDPADRRTRRIALTEGGRERLCGLECALRQAEEQVLAPLEPDEQDVLRRLLQRIATQPDATGLTCTEAEQLAPPTPTRRRRR
jgi:hypothetical protein